MSTTARSLLLIGAFFAFLLSQFVVAEAIGHHIAFMTSPTIVPEPTLFDSPLLRMLFVLVSFAALLELLVGDSVPLEGWGKPFDRQYSAQHGLYLLFAGMALIIVSFVFFLVKESELLQQWFWKIVLGVDGLLGIATVLTVYSCLRTSAVRRYAAE